MDGSSRAEQSTTTGTGPSKEASWDEGAVFGQMSSLSNGDQRNLRALVLFFKWLSLEHPFADLAPHHGERGLDIPTDTRD